MKRYVRRKHGEDHLDGVEGIRLTLENGKTVTLSVKEELHVPDDPGELLREAKRAPARLAFWSYQTERALAQLRAQERMRDARLGEEYLIQRRHIAEHSNVEIPTEGNIKARVEWSRETRIEKERVEAAQRRYGVLRAVREALEHRSHLLRKLISRDFEPG